MKQMKRRLHKEPMGPVSKTIVDFGHVLLGSAIVAIAFNIFLLPNQIASGGVSGISILVRYTLGIEPAFTQWGLNVPLFFAGVLLLGGSLVGSIMYGVKTFVGTLFLPLVVLLTSHWEPATSDPLLAAIFGGIGVGLGLGIVFRSNSSTGGTDLAAQIIGKYTGMSLGACVFIMDGLVVASSAFIFGFEFALYALIGLFITGKTIDLVQTGLGYSKMAIIISDYEEEVKQGLLTKVDRGVTKLVGYGGYTNHERPVLMCVVGRNEVTKLTQVVQTIDPSAFVIVSNASEVLGKGFKSK
nr:YitT family protein [Evansella tamaricis]